MTSWDELQRAFRMVVLRRGDHTVEEIADQIPASRRTVYRLMSGVVQHPSKALRSGVEKVVDKACQVTQPDSTDTQD